MRRTLTIRHAVEWAFSAEKARLCFAEDQGENARLGLPALWKVMQRGALGTKIDCGGHSLPAHNAHIFADALANSPRDLGVRRVAAGVAELALARQSEEWGSDLKPRCVPMAWRAENLHEPQTAADVIGRERIEGARPSARVRSALVPLDLQCHARSPRLGPRCLGQEARCLGIASRDTGHAWSTGPDHHGARPSVVCLMEGVTGGVVKSLADPFHRSPPFSHAKFFYRMESFSQELGTSRYAGETRRTSLWVVVKNTLKFNALKKELRRRLRIDTAPGHPARPALSISEPVFRQE